MAIRNLMGLGLIVFSLYFLVMLSPIRSVLWDPASVVIMLATLAPTTFLIARSNSAHWSQVLLALGVPTGLLGGSLGVTGMALNIDDPTAAYPASGILLLTILYGGVISAVGYFAKKLSSHQNSLLPKKSIVIALTFFILIMGWAMESSAGIMAFVSLEAISVFCAVIGWQIFVNKQIRFQSLAEASLFASILCLILGLIQWHQAGTLDREAIAFALNGLNYGLMIYIVLYLVSLSAEDKDANKIETGRANWHWMEVTAFMIFMLFAPETLRETLANEQDEAAQTEEIEIQERRFEMLEQRLAALEGT
mgnify:FL=1